MQDLLAGVHLSQDTRSDAKPRSEYIMRRQKVGEEAKRNCVRDISVVAVCTANRPSKNRGDNQRDFKEQARTANKHQEEPSEYRKDWVGVRAIRVYKRLDGCTSHQSIEKTGWVYEP